MLKHLSHYFLPYKFSEMRRYSQPGGQHLVQTVLSLGGTATSGPRKCSNDVQRKLAGCCELLIIVNTILMFYDIYIYIIILNDVDISWFCSILVQYIQYIVILYIYNVDHVKHVKLIPCRQDEQENPFTFCERARWLQLFFVVKYWMIRCDKNLYTSTRPKTVRDNTFKLQKNQQKESKLKLKIWRCFVLFFFLNVFLSKSTSRTCQPRPSSFTPSTPPPRRLEVKPTRPLKTV